MMQKCAADQVVRETPIEHQEGGAVGVRTAEMSAFQIGKFGVAGGELLHERGVFGHVLLRERGQNEVLNQRPRKGQIGIAVGRLGDLSRKNARSNAARQNKWPRINGDLVFRICCSRTVVVTNNRVFLTPKSATAWRTVAALVRSPLAAEFTCLSRSTVIAGSCSSTSHRSAAVQSGRWRARKRPRRSEAVSALRVGAGGAVCPSSPSPAPADASSRSYIPQTFWFARRYGLPLRL